MKETVQKIYCQCRDNASSVYLKNTGKGSTRMKYQIRGWIEKSAAWQRPKNKLGILYVAPYCVSCVKKYRFMYNRQCTRSHVCRKYGSNSLLWILICWNTQLVRLVWQLPTLICFLSKKKNTLMDRNFGQMNSFKPQWTSILQTFKNNFFKPV